MTGEKVKQVIRRRTIGTLSHESNFLRRAIFKRNEPKIFLTSTTVLTYAKSSIARAGPFFDFPAPAPGKFQNWLRLLAPAPKK